MFDYNCDKTKAKKVDFFTCPYQNVLIFQYTCTWQIRDLNQQRALFMPQFQIWILSQFCVPFVKTLSATLENEATNNSLLESGVNIASPNPYNNVIKLILP